MKDILNKVLDFIKNILAPVIIYFKGRSDQKRKDELNKLRRAKKWQAYKNERKQKILDRYDRIRINLQRMPKNGGNIPFDED